MRAPFYWGARDGWHPEVHNAKGKLTHKLLDKDKDVAFKRWAKLSKSGVLGA